MIQFFSFTVAILISTVFFQPLAVADTAACPEGYWDLGPGSVALGVMCLTEEGKAKLYFCKREVVMKRNECNTIGAGLPCSLVGNQWNCHDPNEAFSAQIKWIDSNSVSYSFKSSFNEGTRTGKRF